MPLLNEGRDGIEKLRKEAEKLGIVFDEKAAREAEEAADAMTNFRTALRGLSDKTIPKVLQALTNLSNKLAEVISQSEDPIDFIIRLFFVPPNADELMKKTLERAKGLHLLDQVKITTADIPQHFRDIQKEASKAEIEFEKLVEKTVKQNEQLLETQRLTQKVEKLDAKRNEQLFARGEQEAMSAFFRRESADLISQELEFVGAATTARAKTLMLENKLADERAEASHESDIIRFIWQDIGSAISNAVAQGQNFSSVLSNIKKQLIGLGIRGAIGAAIGAIIGGPAGAKVGFSVATGIPLKGKGKQHGGPVFKGVPTLVGEGGRELFVPPANGRIIPNRQTERIVNRNFNSESQINVTVVTQQFNESNVKNVLAPILARLIREGQTTALKRAILS
ncbi:MAG: hypothetical protein ACE5I1_20650 [bacterium]